MPYEYIVHHKYKLVYKKVWGSYTDEDSALAHEYWDVLSTQGSIGTYDELQDLSEVTRYGVSVRHIENLAAHYRELAEAGKDAGNFKPKKIAYIIPSPTAFGTGRIYGSLVEDTGLNFTVFDAVEKACDWLELTPETRTAVLTTRNQES
jgi:hypothetical protein